MIETKVGLPNTCSRCGTNPGETWFAPHVDAARAGHAFCRACAFPPATADAASGAPTADAAARATETAAAGAPSPTANAAASEPVSVPAKAPDKPKRAAKATREPRPKAKPKAEAP